MLIGLLLGCLQLYRKRTRNPDKPPQNTTPKRPDNWHAQTCGALFKQLQAGDQGLHSNEAQQRLSHYGPNLLPEIKSRGPLWRFLSQFHNVLIYVLLGAAAVTLALGHWLDTGVIFGLVVIKALPSCRKARRRTRCAPFAI